MLENLKWTEKRAAFYAAGGDSLIDRLAFAGTPASEWPLQADREAWIDAEARGAIVPHRGADH